MIEDFKFDQKVADTFDSMIEKSIPHYQSVQSLITQMAKDCIQPNTTVYDLGCSTGTTLSNLGNQIKDPSINWVGLDNSKEMLEKTKNKCHSIIQNLQLESVDLNQSYTFKNANLILSILTLQFIRPINREQLVQSIYDGLNSGGACIVVEKVLSGSAYHNRWFIDLYHTFKQEQGYSDKEIMQKRESIENVLVPYSLEENLKLFSAVGFQSQDIFFKWLNFAGFIAIKN